MKDEEFTIAQRVRKKVEEIIANCRSKNIGEPTHDICIEECPIYNLCWKIQDKEEKIANDAKEFITNGDTVEEE